MSTNYTIGGAGTPYRSDGGDGDGFSNPFFTQSTNNSSSKASASSAADPFGSSNAYNPFTMMDGTDPFADPNPATSQSFQSFGAQQTRQNRSISTPHMNVMPQTQLMSPVSDAGAAGGSLASPTDRTSEWLAGFGPSTGEGAGGSGASEGTVTSGAVGAVGAVAAVGSLGATPFGDDSTFGANGNDPGSNPFLDDFFDSGPKNSQEEEKKAAAASAATANVNSKPPASPQSQQKPETGYDVSIFSQKYRKDKDFLNQYLCKICNKVCRNAVEIVVKSKKYLTCEACIKSYMANNDNRCPFDRNLKNVPYTPSKFVNYHVKTMLKESGYEEESLYTECPYYEYGCSVGKQLLKSNLKQHIMDSTNYHMTLLLKQVKHLSGELNTSQMTIEQLTNVVQAQKSKIESLSNHSRISDTNVWIITGSYKAYKHKYHAIYSVNLKTEYRSYLRLVDINNPMTLQSSPFETDDWDVGDFGIAYLNSSFDIPRWMLKLYPILNIYNRPRFNSIIFRVAGHQIKTTKAIDRCDAVIFDKHQNTLQLPAFHITDLPRLNVKRYNCESVYSPAHQTLLVVGGSGVDKKQINSVEQFNLSDAYVLKDHFYDEYISYYPDGADPDDISNDDDDDLDPEAKDDSNNSLRAARRLGSKSSNSSISLKSSNSKNSSSNMSGGLLKNDAVRRASLTAASMKNVLPGTPPDPNVYRRESRKDLLNKFKLEWVRNTKFSMLEPKEDMSTILFSDKSDRTREFVFVGGGWHNGVLNTCQVLNWDRSSWVKLANLNVKQNAAGIRYWEDEERIFLVGGFNKESYYYAEYFDFKQQKWYDLPKTQFKHRYKPAVWVQDKGRFASPSSSSSSRTFGMNKNGLDEVMDMLPSQVTGSGQIVCVAGSGVLKSEAGMCEWLDLREGKWNTLKKGMASYFSLGININQNNWRSWRLFV